MAKTKKCRGRTKKGKPCSRSARENGYCYQHGPISARSSDDDLELTEKQRRFVEAYMGKAAGNATKAARIAGYSGDDITLASVGYENLRKPQIHAAINARTESDPLVATRFDRQRFWTRVMLGKEFVGDEAPAMKDRLKASELLGRSQLDFVERVEHTGKDGESIKLDSNRDLSALSDAELLGLENILEKIENE